MSNRNFLINEAAVQYVADNYEKTTYPEMAKVLSPMLGRTITASAVGNFVATLRKKHIISDEELITRWDKARVAPPITLPYIPPPRSNYDA